MRTVFLATTDFSRLSEGIGVCADAAASESKSAKDRLANRSSIFVLQLSGSAVPLVASRPQFLSDNAEGVPELRRSFPIATDGRDFNPRRARLSVRAGPATARRR